MVTRSGPPARQYVRSTVDLPLDAHRGFGRWRHDSAAELGVTRVSGQEVLVALVEELLRDERLAKRIRKTIAATRGAQ